MDKQLEQKIFKFVYGRYDGWHVSHSESPDFICIKNNIPVLGSEVTELYLSECDARLKNIKNYTLDLLNGGKFRHKDDKKLIRIEKVKYIRRGEDDGPFINAIINEIPKIDKRVELLTKAIRIKESKVKTYLKSCPRVDLLVHDSSGLFHFERYQDLFFSLSHFINRNEIISSKFREIYLITSRYEGFSKHSIVIIPLKLNLFAEDITLLEKLLRKHRYLKKLQIKYNPFKILFYCMYKIGYENLSIVLDKRGIGLIIGSYLYLYSKNGKKIRDYITVPEQQAKGNPILEKTSDIDNNEINCAIEILESRKNYKCCMSLYWKAKDV